MSKCCIYDIIKMRAVIYVCQYMYVNSLYMILEKVGCYMPECFLYDIIKMRVFMCMNAE